MPHRGASAVLNIEAGRIRAPLLFYHKTEKD